MIGASLLGSAKVNEMMSALVGGFSVLAAQGLLKENPTTNRLELNSEALRQITPNFLGIGFKDEAANLLAVAGLDNPTLKRAWIANLVALPDDRDRAAVILAVAEIPDNEDKVKVLKTLSQLTENEFKTAVQAMHIIPADDSLIRDLRAAFRRFRGYLADFKNYIVTHWETIKNRAAAIVNELIDRAIVLVNDARTAINTHGNNYIARLDQEYNYRNSWWFWLTPWRW